LPLENVEWETLRNVKWGPLINKTYDDIIESVGYFTNSATRVLKSKLQKMCGRDADLKEIYGIITTSVAQRSSNRSYYLEPRFKTNCKENELLYLASAGCETVSFNSI